MSDGGPPRFRVEVAMGLPERQERVWVEVVAGTTVSSAVEHSGLLARFPEVRGTDLAFAVYGSLVAADAPLSPDDRVEILRPLLVDPRAARRLRASKS